MACCLCLGFLLTEVENEEEGLEEEEDETYSVGGGGN